MGKKSRSRGGFPIHPETGISGPGEWKTLESLSGNEMNRLSLSPDVFISFPGLQEGPFCDGK